MSLSDLVNEGLEIMKDPFKLARTIIDAENILHSIKGVKYRPPGLYEILKFDSLYVLGDLHGDYDTLLEFLYKNKIIEKINRGEDVKILLLGDYIDRGDKQVELVSLLLLLKTRFPDNIILLRGNHEPPPLLTPYPHDFPYSLATLYSSYASTLYSIFLQFFQKLGYLARIPGKILFLHGGPPSTVLTMKSFEEAFSIGRPCPDDLVLEEILWNDPHEYGDEPVLESPRGAGVLFGKEVTFNALKLAGVEYIVRGHEAVEAYKFNHNGRILTLFDSRIEVYGITKAGYLYITRDRLDKLSLNDLVYTF
jgi:protein phosphatase